MFTFLATIFLIYLVWLLIKPLLISYARRKYTQRVNDMFGQAFGSTSSTGYNSAHDRNRHENPFDGRYYRRKKKIFSKSDGEYVDFVEIEGKTVSSSDEARKETHPREPQVSDAEWEDI